MKKFTFKTLLTAFAILFLANVYAQETNPAKDGPRTIRCGTMEYYDQLLRADPTILARAKAENERKYAEYMANQQANRNPTNTDAITYIPVVYHVVGTAANQAFATDEMLQRQLDVLNRDFAGLNADSSKLPPAFKAIFGHSEIRFALAKRTPTGVATNGIERRVTAQTFTQATVSSLKKTALGGMDQWNGDKYFNLWLANFTDGLLGIATFPGVGPADEQGVAFHYGSIDQPCGSPFAGTYDGGRTMVHEVGHYFYLFHIWGDDGAACTGDDFRTPYGNLPANCTDDTPNQGGNSTGLCPTGVRTDACSPTAPGVMYQNYMDYTNDACYAMFTVGQVCRMQGALDMYRASLKTSDGLTPAPGAPLTNNDVRVSEILNPGSRGYACTSTSQSFCDPFAPQVLIVNDGDAALTSLAIDSKVDGVVVNTFNWTGNIVPGGSAFVTLPLVSAASGAHILTVKTRLPNGQPDARPNSDSANARFSQAGVAGVPLPINEGFEGTTFPPTTPVAFSLFNPDNGTTWARSTLAAKTGVASMRYNCYNYSTRKAIDIFQTPKINTLGADVIRVTFDVAYARYSAVDFDSLEVVYSTDCGVTFKPTGYKKGQTELATNGGATVTGSFTPTAAQWRTETVDINLGCGTPVPSMIIGIKGINDFGNNIYIDNLSITSVAGTALDAKAVSMSPISSPQCPGGTGTANITPTFTFTNQGTTTLTSVAIYYKVDNNAPVLSQTWTGSLAKCSNATVTLAGIPVGGGNHTLRIYTNSPNGSADLAPSNDTLTATFYVQEVLPLDHQQGFESTTFPPTGGWRLTNPDNATTWVRSTAAARTGVASMFIDAFNYTATGQLDLLATPNIGLAGVDSLKVTFDVAYAQFSATLTDTLEVVYSTDCGVTWANAGYKKGGTQLNSIAGSPNVTAAFVPTAAQWRTETLYLNTCQFSGSSIMYGIRFKNGYGNNCYVDNFNISKVNTATYNAAALNILEPAATLCINNFTPRVTIGNYSGVGALTSVAINYQLDNNPPAVFNWTGNLARCSTTVVTLPAMTSVPGDHVLTVYTTNPNNNADQRTSNDTTRKQFNISPVLAAPLSEGFEGGTFPPTNWSVQNPDNLVTWTKATGNARTGTGAMVIKNFTYPVANTVDRFFSPLVQNSASFDSLFVAFDLAYQQGAQYPGATVRPLDTLELMITTDCGTSFKTVWKKWGEDLQTVNDPSGSNGLEFTPNAGDWKSYRVFLTPYVGTSNFQVYLVAKSNRQNNIWIDNINITSKTLPVRLKNQGYLIYPNPFNNTFRIHHWIAPQNLQAAQIFNAAGQLVWDKRFSGNASTEMTVDMSKLASGTYTLKMTYSDKVVVERIVKTN